VAAARGEKRGWNMYQLNKSGDLLVGGFEGSSELEGRILHSRGDGRIHLLDKRPNGKRSVTSQI